MCCYHARKEMNMNRLLLVLAALLITVGLRAQEVNSVLLNLSSGLAGFGYQEEDGRSISSTEKTLLRTSAAHLYFFNPSIRTFDSSGFREIGIQGLHFNRSSVEAADYHIGLLDDSWTFDSLSKLNVTSFGAGLFYGRSMLLRQFSKKSSLFLGYNVVLKQQYLRLLEIKDAPTNNWEYSATIHKWSVLTTVNPRYTYQVSPSLIIDIAVPLQTLSVGYVFSKETDTESGLNNRKGWLDMTGHWNFGFQVSLGVLL